MNTEKAIKHFENEIRFCERAPANNIAQQNVDWVMILEANKAALAALREKQEREDAERDGRVLVLPCKVGDTVYEVLNNTDACCDCENYSSFLGLDAMCDIAEGEDRYYPHIADKPICDKQFLEIVATTPHLDWIISQRNYFGKTIFLTREEAEKALKEVQP